MTAKILIIDDDPTNIKLLADILRGAGELFCATSGAEGIRTALEKQPDIVLLDAEMPDLDGFEVCAALKADAATSEASIIFVTAYSDIERHTQALNLGAIDFISKPISPPIVRARVRNHVIMKAQSDELKRLATTDPLTGLANRRRFDDALAQEWRRARRIGSPLAALMIDIDYFKQFNDAYGHQAGDLCLQKVAQTLAASIRRSGELAARYGGEEFICLLPNTDMPSAMKFGENLLATLRAINLTHAASSTGMVTASIGIAVAMSDARSDAAALVSAADQALYEAKEQGRNRIACKGLAEQESRRLGACRT